jgi:hypothetical protein
MFIKIFSIGNMGRLCAKQLLKIVVKNITVLIFLIMTNNISSIFHQQVVAEPWDLPNTEIFQSKDFASCMYVLIRLWCSYEPMRAVDIWLQQSDDFLLQSLSSCPEVRNKLSQRPDP